MNKLNHFSQKSIELVETIWTIFWARLVIVLLATLLAALAGPGSAINPCLNLLRDDTDNYRVLVTQTYAFNAMSQKLLMRAQSPNQFNQCWYVNDSYSIASSGEST